MLHGSYNNKGPSSSRQLEWLIWTLLHAHFRMLELLYNNELDLNRLLQWLHLKIATAFDHAACHEQYYNNIQLLLNCSCPYP